MIMPTDFRDHALDLYYNGEPDAALILMRIEWDRETLNSFGYLLDDLSHKIEVGMTAMLNQLGEAMRKAAMALEEIRW